MSQRSIEKGSSDSSRLYKKNIVQLGIVVEDVEYAARRYWELFGVGPWIIAEVKDPDISDFIIDDKPVGDIEHHSKIAVADFNNIQFELIQSISGQGSHSDFLKRHGGGVHHVSFGTVDEYDEILADLQQKGVSIEMSGSLYGVRRFTYMNTRNDLGVLFEWLKAKPGSKPGQGVKIIGTYPPREEGDGSSEET
jgi:methylmalonyl-CoA/ethylmalonyl-CoA epimerase